MSADCIFCKIIAGEIPSSKVYEDDHYLAFIDIGPIVQGHTLVIPKAHHDPLTNVPDELLGGLIVIVKKIAAAQKQALGADGINIHQSNGACAGQVVPHVHFHVIPRFESDGHKWNWQAGSYAGPDEMNAMADRIRGAL